MICFRDMTFCNSDCINTACRRHFGEDDHKAAEDWWGGKDVPISWSNLSDGCRYYTRPVDGDSHDT